MKGGWCRYVGRGWKLKCVVGCEGEWWLVKVC